MIFAPQDGLLRFEETSNDELVVVLHWRTILTPKSERRNNTASAMCLPVRRGTAVRGSFSTPTGNSLIYETRALQEAMKRWKSSPRAVPDSRSAT